MVRVWLRMRSRIGPYCVWLFCPVVCTVVLVLFHHCSSRGMGVKCLVAPVSRRTPAVVLARDEGYGRMNTDLVATSVGRGGVCVRVR